MKSDKLLEILKLLDGPKKSRLRDFLASPYYNRSRKLALVYEAAIKHVDSPDSFEKYILSQSKKQLDTPVESRQIPVLKSRLLKLVLRFLTLDEFENGQHLPYREELTAMAKAGLTQHLEKKFSEYAEQLSVNQQMDLDSSRQRYNFEYTKLGFLSLYDPVKSRTTEINQTLNSLNDDYVIRLLELTIALENEMRIKHDPIPVQDVAAYRDLVNSLVEIAPNTQSNPLVQQMLEAGRVVHDKETPDTLKSLLASNERNQSKTCNAYFYRIITNYYVLRRDFGQDLLNQYLHCLHKGYLLEEDDHLSSISVLNIIKCYLTMGRADEAILFLKSVKSQLRRADQIHLYNMEMANCFAAKQEFEAALELVAQVTPQNDMQYLRLKTRTIRWSYSNSQDEMCLSTIASLRTYISANKTVSKNIKKEVTSFCNGVSWLIKIREQREIGISDSKIAPMLEKAVSWCDELQIFTEVREWMDKEIRDLSDK